MRIKVRNVLPLVALATVMAVAAPDVSPVTVDSATADSSDYRLSYQRLPDGKKVAARWNPCQVVTYRVNPTYNSGLSSKRRRAVSEVQEAFRRLSAETGIQFKYVGTSSQIPKNTRTRRWHQTQTSAEIVVAWVNQASYRSRSDLLGRSGKGYSAGTGGYAFKYWKTGSSPWQGVTGRGFVVLDVKQDRKFSWGFGRGKTRGSLILHELGHALGLQHVGATSQTMYPSVLWRSSAKYNSGDQTGLRKLGASAGCVSTPSWVWKDLS